MISTDAVERAILSRFGLSSKEGWGDALCRAAVDIGRKSNLQTERLLQMALTDDSLLEQLVGRITVPESFFFRQHEQLAFAASFIKGRLQTPNDAVTVRVWSAGSSSGSEPYSLAILLKEMLTVADLKQVSLLGNDVNGDAIGIAKEGVYTDWHFRGLDEARRRSYFKPLGEGQYVLSSDIRKLVRFEHRSIQDQLTFFEPSSLDVILFRNVGIYLTSDCLEKLYSRFCGVLRPGGLLCIAPSDPPVFHPDLVKVETDQGIVYRKSGSPSVDSWHLPLEIPVHDSGSRFDAADGSCSVSLIASPENANDVQPKTTASLHSAENDTATAPSDRARDWLFTGQAALESRDPVRAAESFRRAMFLDPVDPAARFWYALALFETGAINRSRAQLNALMASLCESEPSEILADGEATVGEIVQYARSLLSKLNGGIGE